MHSLHELIPVTARIETDIVASHLNGGVGVGLRERRELVAHGRDDRDLAPVGELEIAFMGAGIHAAEDDRHTCAARFDLPDAVPRGLHVVADILDESDLRISGGRIMATPEFEAATALATIRRLERDLFRMDVPRLVCHKLTAQHSERVGRMQAAHGHAADHIGHRVLVARRREPREMTLVQLEHPYSEGPDEDGVLFRVAEVEVLVPHELSPFRIAARVPDERRHGLTRVRVAHTDVVSPGLLHELEQTLGRQLFEAEPGEILGDSIQGVPVDHREPPALFARNKPSTRYMLGK